MAVERIISNDLLVVPQGSNGVALKFKTVPKGEKGEKGETGAKGEKGLTGVTGGGDDTLIYLAL
jgi:hypothetical protein